jgi:hypothetical protein
VLAVGRLSRAAVFAGATLGGACWTSSTPAKTTPVEDRKVTPIDVDTAVARGTIRGTVRDAANGGPLAGVRVFLVQENGASQQGITDERGEYVFSGLEPANYVVRYQPNHLRQSPTEVSVTLEPEAGQRADLSVDLPAPDPGPCCKPYGAPPARRRVV